MARSFDCGGYACAQDSTGTSAGFAAPAILIPAASRMIRDENVIDRGRLHFGIGDDHANHQQGDRADLEKRYAIAIAHNAAIIRGMADIRMSPIHFESNAVLLSPQRAAEGRRGRAMQRNNPIQIDPLRR